jgi:hypothetical protein
MDESVLMDERVLDVWRESKPHRPGLAEAPVFAFQFVFRFRLSALPNNLLDRIRGRTSSRAANPLKMSFAALKGRGFDSSRAIETPADCGLSMIRLQKNSIFHPCFVGQHFSAAIRDSFSEVACNRRRNVPPPTTRAMLEIMPRFFAGGGRTTLGPFRLARLDS